MADGHLELSTESQVVFDVPVETISRVVFPWYYFSGGLKILVNGEEYRLSFVQPNGAEVALARAAPTAGVAVAASKIQDIAEGRAAGKRWRQLLLR
jgi:hypothetical protein